MKAQDILPETSKATTKFKSGLVALMVFPSRLLLKNKLTYKKKINKEYIK